MLFFYDRQVKTSKTGLTLITFAKVFLLVLLLFNKNNSSTNF